MKTTDEYLDSARRVFAKLTASPKECLSRAELVEMVGETDYQLVRGALLATEKVETAAGRAGGLTVKRAQGNRREWGQAADVRARRYLDDQVRDSSNDEMAIRHLSVIYDRWPQSRIAEALSVSQATVSNWLRTGIVNLKYSEALSKLHKELTTTSGGEKSTATPQAGGLRPDDTQYGDWLRAELDGQGINAVDLAARTGIHINTILSLLEGRTEKPQQRTRQRIEKALQSAQPAGAGPIQQRPVVEDTWYYIGLQWTNEEIEQVPDEPGVYIIHDRLGRPAYIGVAHKGAGGIRARLRKHNELRWTSDRRVAYSFSYALAGRMPSSDPSQLAKSLEKLLIKFMGNAILINERDVEDLTA
jgi:transcriptional regulator with XRE-family HTH domain